MAAIAHPEGSTPAAGRQVRVRVDDAVEVRAASVGDGMFVAVRDSVVYHEWFRVVSRADDVLDVVEEAEAGGMVAPGLAVARAILEAIRQAGGSTDVDVREAAA